MRIEQVRNTHSLIREDSAGQSIHRLADDGDWGSVSGIFQHVRVQRGAKGRPREGVGGGVTRLRIGFFPVWDGVGGHLVDDLDD